MSPHGTSLRRVRLHNPALGRASVNKLWQDWMTSLRGPRTGDADEVLLHEMLVRLKLLEDYY